MRNLYVWVFCMLGVMACSAAPLQQEDMVVTSEKELIVLASPPDEDDYYQNVSGSIFNFHIAYAKQIAKHDDVLVFTGKAQYGDYVRELGKDRVVLAEMQDIWMRDFSPSNAASPVMFKYTAAGQGGGRRGQKDADYVQDVLAAFMHKAGVPFSRAGAYNDGGNFVDDYAGNAVVSRKFLRDNQLSEETGRKLIRNISAAEHIAFIDADEQGGLEHADGVAAFIDTNVLIINTYPEDPKYAASLQEDLKQGLPDVVIHEIVTPYDGSQVYDKRFGSACGLYTNMLVTPRRIYFPQFGIAQDKQALAQIKSWTNKTIIPVSSHKICQMGGGVRCMSWQLRGKNAAALLAYAKRLNQ